MISRRQSIILAIGTLGLTALVSACTNNALDPAKINDMLKTACGILVPAATITAIINAQIGITAQVVVDLLCGGFKAQTEKMGATGAPKGSTVEYDVDVNGKTIHVVATVQ
jgi:hypothetical protein